MKTNFQKWIVTLRDLERHGVRNRWFEKLKRPCKKLEEIKIKFLFRWILDDSKEKQSSLYDYDHILGGLDVISTSMYNNTPYRECYQQTSRAARLDKIGIRFNWKNKGDEMPYHINVYLYIIYIHVLVGNSSICLIYVSLPFECIQYKMLRLPSEQMILAAFA